MRLQRLSWTLSVITANTKSHLLTSPPLFVFIFVLLQTIPTPIFQAFVEGKVEGTHAKYNSKLAALWW